MEGEH